MGVLSFALYANRYPIATNNYVNDFANVLNENSKNMLMEKLRNVEMRKDIEITVVTINSIGDFKTGETTIEGFAKGLFNYWGVGKKWENKGIMILVAVEDRQCRIELGSGYSSTKYQMMQKVIDEKMIPNFKGGNYTTGVVEGVDEVIFDVTSKFALLKHNNGKAMYIFIFIVVIWSLISMMLGRGSGIFGLVFTIFDLASSTNDYRSYNRGYSRSSSNSFGGGRSSGGGASGSW